MATAEPDIIEPTKVPAAKKLREQLTTLLARQEQLSSHRLEHALKKQRIESGDPPEALAADYLSGKALDFGLPDTTALDEAIRRIDAELAVVEVAIAKVETALADALSKTIAETEAKTLAYLRHLDKATATAFQSLATALGRRHEFAHKLGAGGYQELAGVVCASGPFSSWGCPTTIGSPLWLWLSDLKRFL